MITWSNPLLSDSADSGSGGSADSGSFSGIVTPQLAYATLALDSLGDLPDQPYIAVGPDAVIQRVRCRFKFWLGEWFLDKRLGVPYREYILVKNPNTVLISFIFRRVLLGTPGVSSVSYFRATIDAPTRTLTADFEALLEDGTVIRATAEPFILTVG